MSKPWPNRTVMTACPRRHETLTAAGKLRMQCTDCNVTVYTLQSTLDFSEVNYPGWPVKIVCPGCLAEYEPAMNVIHDLREPYDPLQN